MERDRASHGQGVGDNTVPGGDQNLELNSDLEKVDDLSNLTGKDAAKNILLVLSEIQDIKRRMQKIESIETTTASLAEQLGGALKRTADLETTVSGNSSKLRKLDEEVHSVNSKVAKQEKTLSGLKSMKEEIAKSSAETVGQMNDLIDTQRQQVDSFNAGTKQLKKDILLEMQQMLCQRDNDKYCQSLKDQAFDNRHNLILVGISEDQNKSTRQLIQAFFKESLGLNRIGIAEARRLGSLQDAGGEQARPIFVKFSTLSHRNLVWRKRGRIPNGDDGNTIRIQADLPKPLREGVQMLYKITRAAAKNKVKGFESARVYNYQLEANGKTYQLLDL